MPEKKKFRDYIIGAILLILGVIFLFNIGRSDFSTPGGATGNATSIYGVPVQDTTGNLSDNDMLRYNLANNQWEYETVPGAGSGTTDTVGFVFDAETKYQVDKALKIAFGLAFADSGVGDSLGIDTVTVGLDTAWLSTNWMIPFVQAEIEDSLNEYSLTADIELLIEDSLDEYSLTTDIASTYETIANVGLIGDDTANYQTAFGWGDHSIQNYLDNDDANVDTSSWNAVASLFDTNYVELTAANLVADTIFADSINADTIIVNNYIDITGNLTISGTLDGVDLSALDADVASDSGSWNAAADAFDTNYVELTAANLISDTLFSDSIMADTLVVNNLIVMPAGSVGDAEIDYSEVTLLDFDYQTNWSLFYSDGSGDVTELDMSTQNGEFLRSNGSAPPSFEPGGSGETNILADTGTFDEASGFGLTQTKAGVELRIRGLQEGSNITITKAGTGVNDTALVISASGGSGVWYEGTDSLFAIDSDDDTLLVLLDDDAGNVILQAATEDQTLRIAADTISLGGDLFAYLDGKGLAVSGDSLLADTAWLNSNWKIATASYADDADTSGTELRAGLNTRLKLSGGTITGNIVMSGSETVDGVDVSVLGAAFDTNYVELTAANLVADTIFSDSIMVDTLVINNLIVMPAGSVGDNEIDYSAVTLLDFDYQTAWQLFYSNTDGDVVELGFGASGTYLKSNGASSAPTWDTPGGSSPWTTNGDSTLRIDSESDTTMIVFDNDAGDVRWQVGLEDQTLSILADTIVSDEIFRGVATAESSIVTQGSVYPVLNGETPGTGEIAYFDANDSIIFDASPYTVISDALTGNIETGIAVTWQTADSTLDFVITAVSGLAIDGNNALVVKPGTGLDTTGGTIFMDMTTDSTGTGNFVRATSPTIAGLGMGGHIDMNGYDITEADSIESDTIVALNVLEAKDTVIVGADAFTDITGDGLNITSGALTVDSDIRNHTLDSAEVMTIFRDTIGYEKYFLDVVHGWNRPLEDSIYLSLPVNDGTSSWLVSDSAGNLTAVSADTFMISGVIPNACTVESLLVCYQTSNAASYIDSLNLYGPDRSSYTNLTDSSYYVYTTNLTATSWTIVSLDVTDWDASAGDRYALKFYNYFDNTDNRCIKIGWVALVTKR